jgi:hypothetical protein
VDPFSDGVHPRPVVRHVSFTTTTPGRRRYPTREGAPRRSRSTVAKQSGVTISSPPDPVRGPAPPKEEGEEVIRRAGWRTRRRCGREIARPYRHGPEPRPVRRIGTERGEPTETKSTWSVRNPIDRGLREGSTVIPLHEQGKREATPDEERRGRGFLPTIRDGWVASGRERARQALKTAGERHGRPPGARESRRNRAPRRCERFSRSAWSERSRRREASEGDAEESVLDEKLPRDASARPSAAQESRIPGPSDPRAGPATFVTAMRKTIRRREDDPSKSAFGSSSRSRFSRTVRPRLRVGVR